MSDEQALISEAEKIIHKLDVMLSSIEQDTKKEIVTKTANYWTELSKQFCTLVDAFSNKLKVADAPSQRKQKHKVNNKLSQLQTLLQNMLKEEQFKWHTFEETFRNEEQNERNKIIIASFKQIDQKFQEYFEVMNPLQQKCKEMEKGSRQFFKGVTNAINSMASCKEEITEKYRIEKREKDSTVMRESLKHIRDAFDSIQLRRKQVSDKEKQTFATSIEENRRQFLDQIKEMIEKLNEKQKKKPSGPSMQFKPELSKSPAVNAELETVFRNAVKQVQHFGMTNKKKLSIEHGKWKKVARERLLLLIESMDKNLEKEEQNLQAQWLLDREKVNDEFDQKTSDRCDKLREKFVTASQVYFNSVKEKEIELRVNTDKVLANFLLELQNRAKKT